VNIPIEWPSMERPIGAPERLWRRQRGWRADTLSDDDWLLHLPPALIESLRVLATRALAGGIPAAGAIREWRPPYEALTFAERIESLLEGGLGFCIVRGLPLLSPEAANEVATLAFATLLGRPVSQSQQGNIVARVEDLGCDITKPGVRGHQTSAELAFHCDRADRVSLLCVRSAARGGQSKIVSSIQLKVDLSHKHPRLAECLHAPLPQDRRGEQREYEPPWCMMPVFDTADGLFVARYIRRFVEDSQRHHGAPRLSHETTLALDTLDAMMQEPGRALEMMLTPGDIQLLNNNVVLHARTAFEDHRQPARRRLLLRVWLSHKSARPLPASFAALYGSTDAGTYRGGVWPHPDM